jgi:hypothetical protein
VAFRLPDTVSMLLTILFKGNLALLGLKRDVMGCHAPNFVQILIRPPEDTIEPSTMEVGLSVRAVREPEKVYEKTWNLAKLLNFRTVRVILFFYL